MFFFLSMQAIYTNADFQNFILTVLALVVLLVLVGCVYTFIRAIILFVFSHNKEDNKKKWRNSIRFMIIGVVLTIVLLFLIPTVLKWMKVPEYDTYTPKNIFSRAGQLVSMLFDLGDIIQQSQEGSEYRGDMYYKLDTPEPTPTESFSDDYSL